MRNVRRCGGPLALCALVAGVAMAAADSGAEQAGGTAVRQAPAGVRLYVFDCGTLEGADITRFGLKANEVATIKMSVACYLVVHPKGTLIWDVGAVPDTAWTPTGQPIAQRIVLADSQERTVTVRKRLDAQLSEAGHPPGTITHVALSHNHWDHTANANQFGRATWLVRQEEHAVMFPAKPASGALTLPATFSALRASKTVLINTDEHDVFGDGTIIAKLTPGHTPGHLVLYVKLAKTGGIVLSGDLYHYPEERTLSRVPIFEVSQEQTRAARGVVDAFLTKTGSQLWIQHDFAADAKLKKAPAYYE